MNKYLKVIVFVLILALFCFSCSDDNKDDITIQVSVLGNPSANGYYKVNGSRMIFFGETSADPYLQGLKIITNGSQVLSGNFYFEATIKDLDEVRIEAIRLSCTDSIKIFIIKDGKEVENASLPGASTCSNNSLEKIYTY